MCPSGSFGLDDGEACDDGGDGADRAGTATGYLLSSDFVCARRHSLAAEAR